jgi:tetratricopeptide (TPR) repeat protein
LDINTFNRAKQAYDAKDWQTAVLLFSQCGTGAGTGEACHLCGNALMRIGRVQEATQAYRAALSDSSYGNQGAIYTNLGKAQMALGDLRGAIDSLRHALADPNYRSAYKAHMALGDAYSKLADSRNAGTSYRQAALDPNNPEPAKSLINLGVSFMQMRRPADAAEAYRTAVDFASNDQERSLIFANLGQAYVSSNRMIEAVNAFQAATSTGYQLPAAAQADYARAQQAVQSMGSGSAYPEMSGGVPVNPTYDPIGGTGDVLPNAEDSGFFNISEADIVADQKRREAYDSVKPHRGLKKAIVIIVIIVALAAALVGAYVSGFGIPSREGAIQAVFTAAANGEDASGSWSSEVSSSARAEAMSQIEGTSDVTVIGMDSAMNDCVAVVQNKLAQGGTLTYRVSLVRSLISWKVTDVERVNTSETADTYASAFTGEQTVSEDQTEQASSEEQAADASADQATEEASTEGSEEQQY